MGNVVDITGKRYGQLYIIGLSHIENKYSYWICRCDCGNVVILRKNHFAYDYSHQKSCGCLHRKNSSYRMKEYHRKKKEERNG